MSRTKDLLITALAPAIWGSTYLVTTEALPTGHPVMLAALRALPAGLILLALTRTLPSCVWILRSLVLGGLNFAVFWSLLFVSAYRLPGGVAAVLGAVQPLMVLALARVALGTKISPFAVAAALAGIFGVGLLILGPDAGFDPLGVAAGLGGAASMAAGTVLSRKWQPPVPPLTFAAWQLTAGGVLLLPFGLLLEPALPPLTPLNFAGFAWIGLIGAGFTYWLWFRGLARLDPGSVSMLGMMSPLTAVVLGWIWLGQALTPLQMLGGLIVLGSVSIGQVANRRSPPDVRPALPRPA